MNRRQVLRTMGASVGAVALTGALVARESGRKVSFTDTDRLPDTQEVMSHAVRVADLVRRRKPGEYGCQMRILSKSLGFFNEQQRFAQRVEFDGEATSGVSKGIVEVTRAIRYLPYDICVRVLTHAMGVLSEEYRLSSRM